MPGLGGVLTWRLDCPGLGVLYVYVVMIDRFCYEWTRGEWFGGFTDCRQKLGVRVQGSHDVHLRTSAVVVVDTLRPHS